MKLRILTVVAVVGALLPLAAASGGATVTPPNCQPAHIKISWSTPLPGGIAQDGGVVVFTNSGGECRLWGVPTIQPERRSGHVTKAVGPSAHSLSMGMMAAVQTLAHGQSVSRMIGFSFNIHPSCRPVTITAIAVQLGMFTRVAHLPIVRNVCTTTSSVTTGLVRFGRSG